MTDIKAIPSISVTYARNGSSTKANSLGMRPMQERAYEKRGEQFLLIKSPPASGKSRALMFIALDKLQHQGLKQVIIVVPEKAIGASFHDEPLTKFGFWADWRVEPKWNLCNAPGGDNGGKVNAVGAFLESTDKVLVCTHATFRFAVDAYGVEKFDDRLIAVDEFHHVSVSQDNKLGLQLEQLITRNRVHVVAMTGSYFRGDAEAVLAPDDEARFDTITYTYYEQLNGYHEHLVRRLRIARRRHLSAEALLVHIRAVYAANRGAYGWPRIWRELHAQGIRVGKQRVQRLMQQHGIRARGKRRFRVTTDSRRSVKNASIAVVVNF